MINNIASPEAEQAVLGAILNNSDCFDRIGPLSPSNFSIETHAKIFNAIQGLCSTGKQADVISVFEQTKRHGVSIDYLNKLSLSSLSSSRVESHAKMVRETSMRRRIAQVGTEFGEIAASGTSVKECFEKASSRFDAIIEEVDDNDAVLLSDAMSGIFSTLQDRLSGINKRIPTGLKDLDRMTMGGIDRSDLVILAGRPSMGKTAAALTIGTNMAEDYSVLMFSMEMPRHQLVDREVAMLGHIPLSFVIKPTEEDTEQNRSDWARIVSAQKKSENLKLYIDDRSARSLMDIRIKAKEVKRKHGLDLIIVDYLQLMSSGERDETRATQVGSFSRGLKSIAKDLDIGILCLAQLNRGLEARSDKRPIMSDLRDSGEIEQDADSIWMLYRDEVYNSDSMDKGVAELIIRKQRQGTIGTVPMAYIGHEVRFDNLDRSWSPASYSKPKLVSRGFD